MPACDPEIAALLAKDYVGLGDLTEATLPSVRKNMAQLAEHELSPQVLRMDRRVPGQPGSPDVIVRVHTPLELSAPAPCVYSIHGGGYIFGTRDIDDLRFGRWCPRFGLIGVSVEYRLAPETPYPGPMEDCYAGLRWVFSNAEALGVDPMCIGIAGASAGGGLAAGLALLCRDRGEIHPAFQMLTYPMLDDRQTTLSSQWDAPVWTRANNTFGWRSYLGALYGSDDVPPYASPARAIDLRGLPPTLVSVGTADGFCDEDMRYATELYHCGVPTELHLYPGAPHGFDGIAPSAKLSRRFQRNAEEWMTSRLGEVVPRRGLMGRNIREDETSSSGRPPL
jgi:acetyl esterase/lipase